MTSTASEKVKKVIPPIQRPNLAEFGLAPHPDFVWTGGVYVCQHNRKTLYFNSVLPVCQNGDRIQEGDLYNTVAGLVRVVKAIPDGCVAQHFDYLVVNQETGKEEKLLTWEFDSACW